jgi:hypothetical protein
MAKSPFRLLSSCSLEDKGHAFTGSNGDADGGINLSFLYSFIWASQYMNLIIRECV